MIEINVQRLAVLDTIVLKSGSHTSLNDGACPMEVVSWLCEEPWSDHPRCACPVVGAFVRRFSDSIRDDSTRTCLFRSLLPKLVGSRSVRDVERARGWLAVAWLMRVCTPAFLELTPSLREIAQELRGLPPVADRASADRARAVARRARQMASNARSETIDGLRSRFGSGAADAADAVDAAAAYAAADAADAAAAYAAYAAYAAADAADAADAAAAYAGYAADAAYAGYAADAAFTPKVREAAEGRLRPVVEHLQTSAIDLIERMLTMGG
jgi:hypothetical protein